MVSLKNLFEDNPLASRWTVAAFWNRQAELDWALDILCDEDDEFEKICVVHGHTRAGKSHFAQRLLADDRIKESRTRVVPVNANNLGNARNVLEHVFVALYNAVASHTPKRDGLTEEILTALQLDLTRVRELLDDGAAERVEDHTSEGSSELSAPAIKVAGLEVSSVGKLGRKETRGQKAVYRPVTDHQLAEQIATAADALRQGGACKRVLLFVDDLDLLDRGGEEGGAEADRVVDLLRPIAGRHGLVIVATMRRLYFNRREKDFTDLGAIRPLKPAELVEIYNLRVRLFNDGREVFRPEALALLGRTANGRVGVFLRHCHDVLRQRRRSAIMPFTEEVVRSHFRECVDDYLTDPTQRALMNEVISAVRGRTLEFAPVQDPRPTGMIHVVLEPLPSREGWYAVNPLFAEVIRDAKDLG